MTELTALRPRIMIEAAEYIETMGEEIHEFAPTGLSNMGVANAHAMIAHARSLGWTPSA